MKYLYSAPGSMDYPNNGKMTVDEAPLITVNDKNIRVSLFFKLVVEAKGHHDLSLLHS